MPIQRCESDIGVLVQGNTAPACGWGLRKSLDGLGLCHGPRVSGADPGLRAVDGSDPGIRHASYGTADGWGVHGNPTPAWGRLSLPFLGNPV